jgi:hypothetical protein
VAMAVAVAHGEHAVTAALGIAQHTRHQHKSHATSATVPQLVCWPRICCSWFNQADPITFTSQSASASRSLLKCPQQNRRLQHATQAMYECKLLMLCNIHTEL